LLSAASLVEAGNLTSSEKQFVEKAAAGITSEIKLAELALRKSQDQKIKDFANRMIADHGKANNDLKPIADAANVKMPDQLKGEAMATYTELAKLSGPEFDRSYISDMVKAHRKDATAAYRLWTIRGTIMKGIAIDYQTRSPPPI
jgi:putative membrane protein